MVKHEVVTAYIDPTCDQCEAPMHWVYGTDEADEQGEKSEYVNPFEGLDLTIGGGYGQYIDPVQTTRADLTILLCKECCDAERARGSAIGKRLDALLNGA